ncbi:methionyl-tRNA formyltransferase [bacterium]|nr:methionyl-tRNA formyltransferase [bacterium]
MRLVFMGTPDFAVSSFWALAKSKHSIVAVVTAPDRPSGRGLKVHSSAVKACALEQDIPLFQPEQLKDGRFVQELHDLQAELFVVVAFRILPSEVFKIPPKGTINLHASLLPKYRGAAPINWAIINGETQTGVTTFFIEERVDTGEMILQKSVSIEAEETAGELHDKLAEAGAALLLKTVDAIEVGSARPIRQTGDVTKAPKISRDLAKISWEKSSSEIHNLVRGLSPVPGAFTRRGNKILKIYRTIPTDLDRRNVESGKIVRVDGKRGLVDVATGSGALRLLELQQEGKRRMGIAEYLKGHLLEVGEKLG